MLGTDGRPFSRRMKWITDAGLKFPRGNRVWLPSKFVQSLGEILRLLLG